MINFRYHLASLIAVFLALALGVVVGSTVVDRAIVSGLRDRIDTVESNAERRKADNDQLRTDLGRVQDSMNSLAPALVAGTLRNVPVAVVAVRGIDAGPVQQTVTLLQLAGARAPGIVWLEGAWELSSRADVDAFATALDTNDRTTKGLRDLAAAALVSQSRGVPSGTLNALVSANAVKYEAVGSEGRGTTIVDWGGTDARLLLVDGPAAKVTTRDWNVAVARAAASVRMPTEVAEVFAKTQDVSDRATRLQAIHDAADLGGVSTVDDLDLIEGRIAAVLSLADLGRGLPGRYGYGPGATRSIPERAAS
ncbi:MAG: copper transporter [Acidimicrobiia bacterium]